MGRGLRERGREKGRNIAWRTGTIWQDRGGCSLRKMERCQRDREMSKENEENGEKQKKTMFDMRTGWMNKTTMMREKTDSL